MKWAQQETSNFYCMECSFKFPLSRKTNKRKEAGHIKDLYCPRCDNVKKFKEFRVIDFG